MKAFLKLAVSLALPTGFLKIKNEKGETIYINELENTTTKLHPEIIKIREMWKEELQKKKISKEEANSYGVRTMQAKLASTSQNHFLNPLNSGNASGTGKLSSLSSFVGQRSTKNSVTGSFMSGSSTAAVPLPCSNENGAQSKENPYCPEVIEGPKIIDSQEKRIYLALSAFREEASRDQKLEQFTHTADQLIAAKAYYEQTYGEVIKSVPPSVASLKDFREIRPDSILSAMSFLGIQIHETKLMFLARLFLTLPLPPFWKEQMPRSEPPQYFNILTLERLSIHPSYYYIIQCIQKWRKRVLNEQLGLVMSSNNESGQDVGGGWGADEQISNAVFTFTDKLGREYTMDMKEYAEALTKGKSVKIKKKEKPVSVSESTGSSLKKSIPHAKYEIMKRVLKNTSKTSESIST